MRDTALRRASIAATIGLWAALSGAGAAELTVCTCASSAPGEASPDLLDGFEIALLEGFAQRRGVGLRLERLDGGCVVRLEGELEEGGCDIGAVTLTHTPERAQRMGLTSAYFPVRMVLVERKDRLTLSRDELAGRTFATPRGLTSEALIQGIPGARIVYVDGPAEAFDAVARGEAEAAAYDSALVLDQIAEYPDLRIGLALSGVDHYSFAVKRGSPLLDALDAYLEEIKGSGEYARLLESHYGGETAQLLLEMLAAAENR